MTVTSAVGRAARPSWVAGRRLTDAAGVLALMAASLALRTSGLGTRLWMDEGIAVGIASHPLTEIPRVLRLDGAPPLYSVLLHLWMGVAGRSELAVHWLSLVFAVACVPVAKWAAESVFGRRTAWVLAVMVACAPFVTRYAVQARMYTLLILLGFACLGCFLRLFVEGRRAYRVPFGVLVALSLYTHNWALFVVAALVAASAVVVALAAPSQRPRLVRDGAVGFGVGALLYLPWVPSLLVQARHTGAPWATAPSPADLVQAPANILGADPTMILAVAGAGLGLVVCAVAAFRRHRVAAAVLVVAAALPVVVGWTLSQVSPAWDARYLAAVVAPAFMLAAAGLAALRLVGLALAAVLVALWAPVDGPLPRSNAYALGRAARAYVGPGDLVVSTAIGQVPVLAYYLPADVRYASPFGLQSDPGVVDWRDAVRHLSRTSTRTEVLPLFEHARPRSYVLLVTPAVWDRRSRQTALGRRQRRRAREVIRALRRHPGYTLVARLPPESEGQPSGSDLRALVFRKRGRGGGDASLR